MKKCKLLITDLDGTLIETLSGDTFPKGIWDMKIKLYVFEAIKNYAPDDILIISNQGGIERKKDSSPTPIRRRRKTSGASIWM